MTLSSGYASLSERVSAVENTVEAPVPAGKVWTSTASGAGWADPTGGGGADNGRYMLVDTITIEESTQWTYADIPSPTHHLLVFFDLSSCGTTYFGGRPGVKMRKTSGGTQVGICSGTSLSKYSWIWFDLDVGYDLLSYKYITDNINLKTYNTSDCRQGKYSIGSHCSTIIGIAFYDYIPVGAKIEIYVR